MINQPENNIKFSNAQQLAIEEVKNRLTNIEAEVSIATKNLKTIKGETEKAVKEKLFAEEELTKLHSQVIGLQDEKESLEKSVKILNENLSKIKEESIAIKTEQEKATNQLNERENQIKESEVKIELELGVLKKDKEELSAEKEKSASFIEKLSEVIKTF